MVTRLINLGAALSEFGQRDLDEIESLAVAQC
jgi:hypothetical protein